MKTTFNKVMQAAVAATALTFASASYAADTDTYSASSNFLGNVVVDATSSHYFKDVEWQNKLYIGVQVFELTNVDHSTQRYVAFCIQPDVDFSSAASYTATYNYTPSDDVRKLYESSYKSTIGNVENQQAFQLALWELQNDDKSLSYVNSDSKQYFAAGTNATVDLAAFMLSEAAKQSLGASSYNYVSFAGSDNGVESQRLLGVSAVAAVPEADTWAMMAVGLGLVGLVGRRKQKNEKFA